MPKDNHDRTIVVRGLQKGETAKQIRARVEYRLEVDEATVENSDMKDSKTDLRGGIDAYFPCKEFTKIGVTMRIATSFRSSPIGFCQPRPEQDSRSNLPQVRFSQGNAEG